MSIAIYELTEIDHYEENNEPPKFIIWDIDERKRLAVAETYEKAWEIIEDWKSIKEEVQ